MRLNLNWQGSPVDHRIARIATPLRWGIWKQKLNSHLDQDFVCYILKGIERGFPIGVDRTKGVMPTTRNMQSASQNPDVVEDYLSAEVAKGNILRPFMPGSIQSLQINIRSHPEETPTRKMEINHRSLIPGGTECQRHD